MRKIKIQKSDYHRILLTEILPFETPLFFSNFGLYEFYKTGFDHAPDVIQRMFKPRDTNGALVRANRMRKIPFQYEIKKGAID